VNFLPPIRLPDPGRAEAAILNAPFEANGWRRAVEAIAEATRSTSAHLLGIGGPKFFSVNIVAGPLAEFGHYLNNAHLHGPCNWRVNTTTIPMAIQHEAHYIDYRRANHTADYDDSIAEIDAPYGCQSALQLHADGMLGLCILRSSRDGPTTDDVYRRFATLRELLARSIEVQVALDGEAADLMLGDLAGSRGATYLLDRHAAVISQTEEGRSLRLGHSLFREGTIRLSLDDPADDRRFQEALAALYAGDRTSSGAPLVRRVTLGRDAAKPCGRWNAILSRLADGGDGLGFAPFVAVTLSPL
jgi:hypothetical protein